MLAKSSCFSVGCTFVLTKSSRLLSDYKQATSDICPELQNTSSQKLQTSSKKTISPRLTSMWDAASIMTSSWCCLKNKTVSSTFSSFTVMYCCVADFDFSHSANDMKGKHAPSTCMWMWKARLSHHCSQSLKMTDSDRVSFPVNFTI